MIDERTGDRSGRGRPNFIIRILQFLRRLVWLNPFRIVKTIAEFEDRQLRLERSQREIENLLHHARSKIETVLQIAEVNTSVASILDIKNLGYELGRSLAEQRLSSRPIRVDRTQLRSKLCTQDDFDTD